MPKSKGKRIALFAILALVIGAILIIENPFAALLSSGSQRFSSGDTQGTRSPDGSSGAASGPTTVAARIDPAAIQAQGVLAQEIAAPDFDGIEGWLNSQPLSISQLKGKVVLVDFWTYTCVNCIRTLPYIKEWHTKYADKGLQIVGVHTPEFAFEKERANVEKAVKEFDIKYPVAQDNDFKTWRAFSNRFWPHKYLIDKDGLVRYHIIGEGKYQETEEWIQRLLTETGTSVKDVGTVSDAPGITREIATSITPELYMGFGYSRGQLGNLEGHNAYMVMEYTDPKFRENGKFYAQGEWYNDSESLIHARVTRDLEDYIIIPFNAGSVNAVIQPEETPSFEVYVTVDGVPVEKAKAGEDIRYKDNGDSYMLVDTPKMYSIFKSPQFESHELKLASNSDNFGLYAFTFGP